MSAERPWSKSGSWPLIAVTVATTVTWVSFTKLNFDWNSAVTTVGACALLIVLAYFYRTKRPEPRIANTLDGLAQVIVFGACATPLSYAVASTGGPLWDTTFHNWDQALGLDWRSYLIFADQHPKLGLALTLAYRSLMLQMMLVVILLGFGGRFQRLQKFILAFVISGISTILISGLTPAMANFVFLGLSPADFPNLQPAASFVHVEHLAGLRDGTLRTISLDHIEGIITFPSFHATLGALFLWAFWGVKAARLPALVVNVLLIAATPIDGGHYFVDVIAGLVIAAVAVTVAHNLVREDEQAFSSQLSTKEALLR